MGTDKGNELKKITGFKNRISWRFWRIRKKCAARLPSDKRFGWLIAQQSFRNSHRNHTMKKQSGKRSFNSNSILTVNLSKFFNNTWLMLRTWMIRLRICSKNRIKSLSTKFPSNFYSHRVKLKPYCSEVKSPLN